MTPKQALEETIDLWTQMAMAAETGKTPKKLDIPGPWEDYRNTCPCCEMAFANKGCANCPMAKQWRFYSGHRSTPCDRRPSPYRMYYTMSNPLCLDVAFFCYLIVDMAEEALKELGDQDGKNPQAD